MNKIQAYFNYFDKYRGVENWEWYKSLTHWTKISIEIKKEVSQTTFSIEEQEKELLENIIKEKSNSELKTINDYCQRYLFESENGVSTIRQQLLTHERRNEILNKINNEPKLLIEILKENDRIKAENKIREILVDNTNSVIYRYLRVLFPENFAAPDAPDRLNQRIDIIKSKLGLDFTGNPIEKHKKLMDSIESDNFIKKQIFFWEIYDMLESSLNLKKAIVYYGAPGTGKTFKAKRIATQFIDQHRIKIENVTKNNYHVKTVQFHPSYSYEDFIEGIRPSSDKSLKLFNGTFKEFCKTVGEKEINLYKDIDFINNDSFKERDYRFSLIKVSELNDNQKQILGIDSILPEGITVEEVIEPAFFIIDEINRAELSRVFGELMFSLEYRGYNGKIKTQYSYLNNESDDSVYFWDNSEDWFFIPQNVYIIGTMNNIDRSVDSFDFALRRRFMWEEIQPDFNTVRNILSANWKNDLAIAFERLNNRIESEELLGKDYRIGHSYALEITPIQNRFDSVTEAKKFLWYDYVMPLLEEYLRGLGDENKAQEKLNQFKKEFGI